MTIDCAWEGDKSGINQNLNDCGGFDKRTRNSTELGNQCVGYKNKNCSYSPYTDCQLGQYF